MKKKRKFAFVSPKKDGHKNVGGFFPLFRSIFDKMGL